MQGLGPVLRLEATVAAALDLTLARDLALVVTAAAVLDHTPEAGVARIHEVPPALDRILDRAAGPEVGLVAGLEAAVSVHLEVVPDLEVTVAVAPDPEVTAEVAPDPEVIAAAEATQTVTAEVAAVPQCSSDR